MALGEGGTRGAGRATGEEQVRRHNVVLRETRSKRTGGTYRDSPSSLPARTVMGQTTSRDRDGSPHASVRSAA